MSGLDPNLYVNKMKFSATYLLAQHMDPENFDDTWAKFVLSANKWLARKGFKEYDEVALANLRGRRGSSTSKILNDLGQKACRVADLIGILEDAEMRDIVEAKEFKLETSHQKDKGQLSAPQATNRTVSLTNTGSSVNKAEHRRRLTVEKKTEEREDDYNDDDEEYATASSGGEEEDEEEKADVSSHPSDSRPLQSVKLVTVKKGKRKRSPPSGEGAPQSTRTRSGAADVLKHFRKKFIDEMNAEAVVIGLVEEDIIDKGDKRRIEMEDNPTRQNEILHMCLTEKCTEDALMTVCDVIIAVKGNQKMKALGKAMKKRLEEQ